MWYRIAQNGTMSDSKSVACVIVLRKQGDKVEVLLEQKSPTKFGIPGGKIEAGESSESAAVREIKEETHLKLKKKKLHLIEKSYKSQSDGRFCDIYAYKYKDDKEPVADSDCEALRWFDINDLPEILWNGKQHILKAASELYASQTKMLFLDCDGVLNVDPHLHIMKHPEDFDAGNLAKYILKDKIKLLNQIVEEVNPTIVISSAWRNVLSIKEIQKIFEDKGFIGELECATEKGGVEHDDRWKQINKIIKEYKPERYAILDDDHLTLNKNFDNPNFIKTIDKKGLTQSDVDKTIKILKGE
jgi:8-oxo-dGTP pyrophosphatase MutT (NUDIX family)